VLNSELRSLGHPPAALLGFAAAVLACNVLALLQRAVEQTHQPPPAPPSPAAPPPPPPPLEVSCFHLAVQVRGGYEGLLIALPPEHWPRWNDADPAGLAGHRHCQLVALGSCWSAIGVTYLQLRRSGDAADLGPNLKGLGPGGSILDGWNLVAAELEEVVDPVVSGEEALCLAG